MSPEAREVLDRLAGRDTYTLDELIGKLKVTSVPIVESLTTSLIKEPLLRNLVSSAAVEIMGDQLKRMIGR